MIDIWRELYRRLSSDDVGGFAAELAFYFLLSIFPFLVFALTLIGFLPLHPEKILTFLSQYIPAQSMDLIRSNVLAIVGKQNSQLLSISLIGALWTASNGINGIIRVLNRAYNVQESRPYWKAKLTSILLTVAMILMLVVALALPVFGERIADLLAVFNISLDVITTWNAFRWTASSLIIFLVFLFMYSLAPNIRLTLQNVGVGALFATLGWNVVSYGFSYYVRHFSNYAATYGSLGAIIVLMLWFYFTAYIIVIGGELNALVYHLKQKKRSPEIVS